MVLRTEDKFWLRDRSLVDLDEVGLRVKRRSSRIIPAVLIVKIIVLQLSLRLLYRAEAKPAARGPIARLEA